MRFGKMKLHLRITAMEDIVTELKDIILGGPRVAFGMNLQIFVDQKMVIKITNDNSLAVKK